MQHKKGVLAAFQNQFNFKDTPTFRNKLRVFLLTGVMALGLGSCSKQKPFTAEDIEYGGDQTRAAILFGDPQVYSREALINDRRSEIEFLEAELKPEKMKNLDFSSEITRITRDISELAGSLGIDLKPGIDTGGGEKPKTEGVVEDSEVGSRVVKPEDLSNQNLDKLTSHPRDRFLDVMAYRAEVRQALSEARLDDQHDEGGNALYRLQFPALVLPPQDGSGDDRRQKRQWGGTLMNLGPPEFTPLELYELYSSWIGYLASRLNYPEISNDTKQIKNIKVDQNFYANLAATGLVDVLPIPIEKEYQRNSSLNCPRLGVEEIDPSKCTVFYLALPEGMLEDVEYLRKDNRLCRFVRDANIRVETGKWPQEKDPKKLSKISDAALAKDRCVPTGVSRELKTKFYKPLDGTPEKDNQEKEKPENEFRKTKEALKRSLRILSIAAKGAGLGVHASDFSLESNLTAAFAEFIILIEEARLYESLFEESNGPEYIWEEIFGNNFKPCSSPKSEENNFRCKVEESAHDFAKIVRGEYSELNNVSRYLKSREIIRVYDVAPIELAHQRSTSATRVQSYQMAAALAGSFPGAGVGLETGLDYLRSIGGKAEMLERLPVVIGFSESVKKNAEQEGRTSIGWLFGPKMVIDVKESLIRLSHRPARYQVYADISLPAWWPYIDVDIESAWISNWNFTPTSENPAPKPAFFKDGENLHKTFMRIPLPRNDEMFGALTQYILKVKGRNLPSLPLIELVSPKTINSCSTEATFVIQGHNLWQSPEAFLNGNKASEIRVLPDMRGISAKFNPQTASRGLVFKDAKTPVNANLVVATRNGTTRKPIIFFKGECKSMDSG